MTFQRLDSLIPAELTKCRRRRGSDLVEADPVPGAGGEGLQRAVQHHGVDVGAPVALRLQAHQRSLEHLPQLRERRVEEEERSELVDSDDDEVSVKRNESEKSESL